MTSAQVTETMSMSLRAEHKAKVLIVYQSSLPDFKRNMNAYQRVFYGAESADVILLLRRGQFASHEIAQRARVCNAPMASRWLFFLYAVVFAICVRFHGFQIIITEPSGFVGVGFLARALAGYFWVLDLWDRPRWRPGHHDPGRRIKLSDRLVFWMCRFADCFLMSVLPQAAKDIDPRPDRCVFLRNAIDLSDGIPQPAQRHCDGDITLHLAYARSKFFENMGLAVVIQAAEMLADMGCPVVIHIIGQVPESTVEQMKSSPAAGSVRLHGIIGSTRSDFFRTVHVGLAPYPSCEDLAYIFPIKVLEHLKAGNPVIASDLPGLASMIEDGYNGLLVKPGDPRSLADAIARLQKDVDFCNRLGRNASASIRCFDAAEKNRTVFDAVLSRAAVRSSLGHTRTRVRSSV